MAHDVPLERWLKANGYVFKFVQDFPLDQIDMAEAANNPARLGRAFDNNLAYEYAQAYEAGDDFPALLLIEVAGQPLKRLGGGTHRVFGAGAAKKTTHDVILVREPDEARIDLMMRVANSKGVGRGETEKGKLQHIAELRRLYSQFKVDDLSKHFSVRRPTVLMYLRVSAAEERGERFGLGQVLGRMSQDLKVELNGLQSDTVFVGASRLVESHLSVLRGETGVELVKTLRDAGTERRALSIIADRDKELTEAADDRKAKGIRTPPGKLTKYLGYLHALVRHFPGSVQKLYLAGLGSWRTMSRELKMVRKSKEILSDLEAELVRMMAEAEKAAEWKQKVDHGD
jgi:hypothetical protein